MNDDGNPHGEDKIAANGQCWSGTFDRGVLINNKANTRGQYGHLITVYKTSQEIVESQDAVAAQSAAARARAAEEEALRQELAESKNLCTIFVQSQVNLSNIPVTNTKGAIQENCPPINTDKPKNKSRHKQTCFERFSLCLRWRSSAKVAARG